MTEIEEISGVSTRSQQRIRKKAEEQGYRPEEDPRIFDHYVEDRARSGRPKEINIETEQQLIDALYETAGREKSAESLAHLVHISAQTARTILKKHGFNSVKPTRKPGLSEKQRAARLAFALKYAHWTVED